VARRPRQEIEGGVHHVYARGNDHRAIYLDDADRDGYLRLLRHVIARQGWRCLAFCLMGNHLHLLIETPMANLGTGMQRLHGFYARDFNGRHGRSGHVFQGRYGSVLAATDEQVWTTAAYIALNPVVAGLCARPEDWRWSSHRAALGAAEPGCLDVGRLLEYLGAFGGDPRRRYAEMVADGLVSAAPKAAGTSPPAPCSSPA
jgi:REP element-mobilizing transposase RayT